MRGATTLTVAALVACLPAGGAAAVISFDDLPSGTALVSYQGLTWGTSVDDVVPGYAGFFSVLGDGSYATPRSSPNYVYNAYGPNNLSFSFTSPVSFTGAWFATAGSVEGHRATQVRVHDDLGNVSAWLDLSATPQFLAANFAGSTTIYVERQGGVGGDSTYADARWYTMDDVTYEVGAIPEPTTLLLIGSGLLGAVARRGRPY